MVIATRMLAPCGSSLGVLGERRNRLFRRVSLLALEQIVAFFVDNLLGFEDRVFRSLVPGDVGFYPNKVLRLGYPIDVLANIALGRPLTAALFRRRGNGVPLVGDRLRVVGRIAARPFADCEFT